MSLLSKGVTVLFILILSFTPDLLANYRLKQPGLRWYFPNDTSSYAGIVLLNQVWTRYIWNNPDVNGNNMGGDWDFAVRRSRAIFYSNLFDKVFMYTMIGSDGISYGNSGKPQVSLYNAQTEYAFVKDKFHLGFGLNTWNGVSRYNNCKLLEFLVADNPDFVFPLGGRTDRLGRQMGVYAKGTLHKLHYRVSIVKPFSFGISESEQIPSTTERLNDNLALKGYFAWHFFEKENTSMPYMTMNNLGRTKLFNVGAGFYYHPESMISPPPHGLYHNIFLFAIDAFLDIPINKNAALTSYLGYNSFDFGPEYIRSSAKMNVSAASPGFAIAQGIGNAEWETGTGQIIRGELGYLLPGKTDQNRLQPYGAFTWKNFEALDEASFQFDAGINWLMHGHNLKWTLQYSSRPVYDTVGDKTAWTDSKGQVILQTQIYF